MKPIVLTILVSIALS